MVGLSTTSVPSGCTATLLSDCGSKRVPLRYQLRVGPEFVQVRVSVELAEMTTGDLLMPEMLGLAVIIIA